MIMLFSYAFFPGSVFRLSSMPSGLDYSHSSEVHPMVSVQNQTPASPSIVPTDLSKKSNPSPKNLTKKY